MWLSAFEPLADGMDAHFDLMMELESIYEQILPFYKQLHAYFRRQLSAVFKGDKGITKDSAIPAHLLSKFGRSGEAGTMALVRSLCSVVLFVSFVWKQRNVPIHPA